MAKGKMCPQWIMARENVGPKKRRSLGRKLALGGDGARERMWPEGEDVPWGKNVSLKRKVWGGGGDGAKEKMCLRGNGAEERCFPRKRWAWGGNGAGEKMWVGEKCAWGEGGWGEDVSP